jgi:hypothetical protein
LLYVVFKVQFRETASNIPFQTSTDKRHLQKKLQNPFPVSVSRFPRPSFWGGVLKPRTHKGYSLLITLAVENTYPFSDSSQENRIIPKRFPADAFNLPLTTATEEVEANLILVWLNQLIQMRSQLGRLDIC